MQQIPVQQIIQKICSIPVWDKEGLRLLVKNLFQSMNQSQYSIQAETVCCYYASDSRPESGRSSPAGYVSRYDVDIEQSDNTQHQLHYPSYVHMDPGAATITVPGSVAQLEDEILRLKTIVGPDYEQMLHQKWSANSDTFGSFYYELDSPWTLRKYTKTSIDPSECIAESTNRLTIILKINAHVIYLMCQELCGQSGSFGELIMDYFTLFAMSPVKKLMEIVTSLSKANWSADHICPMLLAYEALMDIPPIMKKVLPSESDDFCSEIRGNMREAFRGIFDNIKNFIQRDMENRQDVSIHSTTSFLICSMNFFNSHKQLVQGTLAPGEDTNSFGHLFSGVISFWNSELKEHSKLYADIQRQYIFLLNNTDHLNKKTIGLFDGLLSRMLDVEFRSLFESWAAYMEEACRSCFKPSCWWRSPRLSSVAFTSKFNETFGGQTTWTVRDPVLRQKLRNSIQDCILPEYRRSLENNSSSGLYFCSCLHRDLAEDIYDEDSLTKAVQGLFEG